MRDKREAIDCRAEWVYNGAVTKCPGDVEASQGVGQVTWTPDRWGL